MENEIEILKRKILDEELEYWKLKYDAASYEDDYWRAMAMNAGVVYDLINNSKSFPIRHAPAQHREGSGGAASQ